MSAVTTSGLVTAANIKTTSGVFWANGAPYGGSAGGSTNSIQYNSSNTFAGATNFTYTAQTGNVVIGATTTSTSSSTGALVVSGGVGIGGNLNTGSTSINGPLIGSTTSPLQITGDVTLSGSNRSVLGNMYYQGGWKYAANGAGWGFREDNTGVLQFMAAPVNSSGALAAASPTYPISLYLATGNVAISTSTATSSTTTGAFTVAGGAGIAGNITAGNSINFTGASPFITFTAANPWINATSYIHFPGGAYFNSGSVYTEASLKARGGLVNDSGTKILTVVSTSQLSVANNMSSTSTTTGALLVSGGVGIAGAAYVGGNLTVGTGSTNNRANLLVFGGNLNAGPGSSIEVAEFYTTNGNGDFLQIIKNRHAQGSDWTTANTRIQQVIDSTPQGYIEFNPRGENYGVAIGTGVTEAIRVASSGNVVIVGTTPSTSTTTGELVVKGGVGIAGQVTAGNVMTTSGVFWANGAAYSSGSGGAIATTGIFLNSNVITANTTISSGQNGFSVGPMTQSNGVVVTIAPGQRWVIV
jgi:hypothetical protein